MIKLRYYGGSFEKKHRGCSTCGGHASTGRARVMSESIQFPSDTTQNGLRTVLFSVGRDYFVSEYEAEYLLSLAFVDINGITQPKFRKVDEPR